MTTVGDGTLKVDIQNYTTRGCHLLFPPAKSSGIQTLQKTAWKLLLDHSTFIWAAEHCSREHLMWRVWGVILFTEDTREGVLGPQELDAERTEFTGGSHGTAWFSWLLITEPGKQLTQTTLRCRGQNKTPSL